MHDEFEDLLLAYTTHSLTAVERARMERHLAECAACRESLREWQSIAAATRNAARTQAVTLPILNVETLVEKEQTLSAYDLSHPRRERSLTLVYLVAALFAIMGAFVISQFPGLNTALIQPAQTSPTPVVYVDIVIARQPIHLGSVITEQDVLLYQLPESAAPFNAVVDIETVIGKIARTSIPCGQPVLANMFTDNARDVFDDPDFVYGCEGIDLSPLREPLRMVSIVIAVQELPQGIIVPEAAVTLRPYPAQLVHHTALRHVDDAVRRIMAAHVLREQAVLSPVTGQVIPPGSVAITIPLESIHSDIAGLRPGSHVDVIVGMLYVPVNEDFQTLWPNGEPVQLDDGQEPKLLMQRIISDAEILTIAESEDSMILAVTSDDAMLMIWLIEARLPLLLARTDFADGTPVPS